MSFNSRDFKGFTFRSGPAKTTVKQNSTFWDTNSNDIDDLMIICKENRGSCKIIFHLPNQGSSRPLKILAHNISVSSSSNFINLLRSKYGKDNVWID